MTVGMKVVSSILFTRSLLWLQAQSQTKDHNSRHPLSQFYRENGLPLLKLLAAVSHFETSH
jgi:hypothetical protein